ncbi:hypothetical protein DH2020_026304 [Rehmannia glutinosa]|uniref:Myb/SANT-like domain-containing protein n=1 Tax=Rehmannia glutinosa TaxID=99300 RepID=A0ABR0VX88_REHGL
MANLLPPYIGQGEFYFLKMIAEEIEKGYKPGSTFKPESQLYVFTKFRAAFGPFYPDRFLKYKIKQLKKRYQDFSELLSQNGINWNKKKNVVYGNEKLLRETYKGRYAKAGEKNFDLMCQVFESGVMFE